MSVLSVLRKCGWKLGLDISPYHRLYNAKARKKAIMQLKGIDVVLDVGAGDGRFSKLLRSQGYKKRIVSFEPLSTEFRSLERNSSRDREWRVFNFALGSSCAQKEINVALNKRSSSFLEMLPAHYQSAPDSIYIGKERVEVKTLDSIFDMVCSESDKIFLKIDTQGYEKRVLDGAKQSLSAICLIQMEMSFVPLYKDEASFCELYEFLFDLGFRLISLEEVLADGETYQLQQVDGLFSLCSQ